MDWSTRRTTGYAPRRPLACACARHGSAPTRRLRARHRDAQLGGAPRGPAARPPRATSPACARWWSTAPRATTRWRWRGAFADAVVVALGENVGFGRANNRGLAEVSEPVAVLVNPDVELLDDSLRALAAQAARHPTGCWPRSSSIPTAAPGHGPSGARLGGRSRAGAHPGGGARRHLRPRGAMAGAVAVSGRRARWAGRWGARSPRGPTPCGASGPLTRPSSSTARTWSSACARPPTGVQTWFWPAARVCHHRAHASAVAFGGEPFARLAAARHDVVRARLGARRAAVDDALQALTFALADRAQVGAGAARAA